MLNKGLSRKKIEINTEHLDDAQIRMIKRLNHLLLHLSSTTDEREYFDSSAEFMRSCATLIKEAKYSQIHGGDQTPYASQALEYSLDKLIEFIDNQGLKSYDN